ncbi:tyrosine-type recombinase/integrase [Burkholderia aenigmatica]|uniref:tyrosine-type recombinase/integrase n=1 Tax=Burkholderia aenigmatica TaxID=2015348 RepID=UPI00264E6F9B|nr:tyrosine-type recombinase/integrase [Burkholderia aenigmatica]MDN7881355.1 tyrosine-type recombinase/integrase [Burkholderia aenigmatica]
MQRLDHACRDKVEAGAVGATESGCDRRPRAARADGDGPPKLIKQNDKRDFARACKVAEMVNFNWHDLRHTWASWHVQRGTPLMVLKELGGWETIALVQKYAHLAPSHLAQHAGTVTFWAQSGERKQKTPLSEAAQSLAA